MNMTYAQALKEAQAKKAKEGYMVIQLRYDVEFVLQHKAGIAFLESLVNAELFKETYSSDPCIKPFQRSSVSVTLMSCEEYEHHKIAALMGISYQDATEGAKA
jgi:hypothetical protein